MAVLLAAKHTGAGAFGASAGNPSGNAQKRKAAASAPADGKGSKAARAKKRAPSKAAKKVKQAG